MLAFWVAVALFAPFLEPMRWARCPTPASSRPWARSIGSAPTIWAATCWCESSRARRYTIGVALVATLLACGAGALLGLLAAVTGGWFDSALSRVLDTLVSIPSKMFALVVIAGFGSSVPLLIAVAAIVYTPGCYRIIRSLAVNINAMDYVTVARARGEGRAYIMRREILPNITGPLLADMGLRFVYALRLLASLSFLGPGRAAADGGLGLAGAREPGRAARWAASPCWRRRWRSRH